MVDPDRFAEIAELFRAANHEHGQARSLNNLGWAHAQLDNPESTLVYCHQALAIFEQFNHPNAERIHRKLHRLDRTAASG